MPQPLPHLVTPDPESTPSTLAGDDLVVRTRFVPPRLRPQIVHRPRVDAMIAQVIDFPLAIVKAEAGYGKTTAVASWLASASHPSVWYHVGDQETDPHTFLLHLVGALQTLHPDVGSRALLKRDSEERSPRLWRAVVDALSNDLLDRLTTNTVLVLDDYDSVNVAEVNAIIDRLVETMPPQLHLVITARTMPSLRSRARWRATGEMLEVTRADLAFTGEEVTTLFSRRQPPGMSAEAARAIAAETEGWPIALQMLSDGLTATDTDALDTLLRRIPGPAELLFDYLADEVFLRQPPETRRFLGESATLRRLDPAACDSTLELTNSADILRSLEQQSLFLTRDAAFRYHNLFGDFLLRRSGVSPERRRQLHLRAAEYYARTGEAEETVYHLIAGGDSTSAAGVLGQIADQMLAGGRQQALGAWLDQLPVEALAANAELLFARAETHRLASRYADALPAYQRAIAAFRSSGNVHGEIRALRGEALLYLDTVQPRLAEPLLRRAMRKARGDRSERQALYLLLAENTLNAGNLRRAERMYRVVTRGSPRGGAPVVDPRLFVRLGRLADVRTFVEAQRRAEAAPLLRPRAPRSHRELSAMLAWVEAMMGDAELARQHAEESLDIGHALGSPTVECIATARLGLGWLCGHDRDLVRARGHCLDAIRTAERLEVPRFEVEPLLGLIIADGMEGRPDAVERGVQRALTIIDDSGDRFVRGLVCLASGAALALAERANAEAWLREAARQGEECGDRLVRCLAALWLAIHRSREGRTADARESFAQALEAAQRDGFGFLFLGTALLAPREPSLWRGMLRRAQEDTQVGDFARLLARQFDAGSDASGASGTVERPSTAPLYIQTLGPFRVWRRGQELERAAWTREKALHVLQLMVCHRGVALHREQFIDALWHDGSSSTAATGLRVALSALRDALSPERESGAESPFIRREGDALRLAMEAGIRVDADEFARLLKSARSVESTDADHAITLYESALGLYRGEFLSEHRYVAWADAERQQHRHEFLASAERLALLLLRADEHERAARWAETMLTHDPLWEGAYAVLMEAYWRQGNRALAVRTFNRCRKRLQSALGVAPSERIMTLMNRISRGG
ncbi:MAG: BTAD domain-containing putative transcriptional regulator [Gemmatimonadaceae bacterium]